MKAYIYLEYLLFSRNFKKWFDLKVGLSKQEGDWVENKAPIGLERTLSEFNTSNETVEKVGAKM